MFYGTKVWPFYCMKLKLGKWGSEGETEGAGDALPQLLVATPHCLHNLWHLLPAMPAPSVWGHTLIVMLGE